MSIFDNVPSIPRIRPALNVGCLFDIITGSYHFGEHGESILNAGQANIISVAGPGNSFKSVIAAYFNLTLAERYKQYQVSIYDSENSLTYNRLNILAQRFPKLSQTDLGDENLTGDDIRFRVTSAAEVMGDAYFEIVKKMHGAKIKEQKSLMLTTPFLDSKLNHIMLIRPNGILIDSLSQLEVESLNEKTVDKNAIGDSGNNMMYMKGGIAKKQLINQSMNMGATASMFFTYVAHVGEEFQLEMFPVHKHKLTHSKKGAKITGTTKAFEFINNVIYEIFNVTLLNNKERGTGVLYPNGTIDKEEDTTDLLLVTVKPTRNKSGPSGVPLEIIVSQREGLLPHLTQFHYCKTNEFGIEGSAINYAMSLRPDVKLSRTTVREKIDSDYLLRRAIEVTSDLLQMLQTWKPLEDDLMCDPATLYADLKLMGFNWDVLLNTRSYWVFEESKDEELPFLSTMDLLRMRKGLYHPYWLPK